MRISTKFICAAAGIAGAFLLGGIVYCILTRRCKVPCVCSFPCGPAGVHVEESLEENENSSQDPCTSEVIRNED